MLSSSKTCYSTWIRVNQHRNLLFNAKACYPTRKRDIERLLKCVTNTKTCYPIITYLSVPKTYYPIPKDNVENVSKWLLCCVEWRGGDSPNKLYPIFSILNIDLGIGAEKKIGHFLGNLWTIEIIWLIAFLMPNHF